MILADENISASIIRAIREAGIEVVSVFEEKRGISDEEVIALSKAKDQGRIILTEDKDFGEWVYAHKDTSISVIFLRYSSGETDQIINILTSLLRSSGVRLFGKFTTVTVNKIRIREL